MTFQFKQFTVKQTDSSMKISTDSVLLGAWLPIKNPKKILDIGAGTGILSLMMAQRTQEALIDAVEIDFPSYKECLFNVKNSPWHNQIQCHHHNIEDFTAKITSFPYDLIVSNPPFFTAQTHCKNFRRHQARNAQALTFDNLLHCVKSLLNSQGIFSVVIPSSERDAFICLAQKHQLFPFKEMQVKGHKHSPIKRCFLCFCKKKQPLAEPQILIIETQRHCYTNEYISLTKDFYLKM